MNPTEAIRKAAASGGRLTPHTLVTKIGDQRLRWSFISPTTADTLHTVRPHLRRAHPDLELGVLREVADGSMPVERARFELQTLAARLSSAQNDPVMAYAHILAGVTGWAMETSPDEWAHVAGRVVVRPEDAPSGTEYLLLADLQARPAEMGPGVVTTVADMLSNAIHRLAAEQNGRVAASFASFRVERSASSGEAGPSVGGDPVAGSPVEPG